MTDKHDIPDRTDEAGCSMKQLIRRDGLAVIVIILATIVVELGFFLFVRSCGIIAVNRVIATLAIATLWCCLTSSAFSAGGQGTLSTFIRAGSVCDGSLVALLIVWIICRRDGADGLDLGYGDLMKVYLILASVSIVSAAVVDCVRKPTGRLVMSLLCTLFLLGLLVSPVWSAGLSRGNDPVIERSSMSFSIHINPFYSVTAAVNEKTEFVWHGKGDMYFWLSELRAERPITELNWHYLPLRLVLLSAGLVVVTFAYRRIRANND